MALILAVGYFIATQAVTFSETIPELKEKLLKMGDQLQDWIQDTAHVKASEVDDAVDKVKEEGMQQGGVLVGRTLATIAKRYFRRSIELANGKIGTGFIGTPAILPALVKIGASDLAEAVFLQPDVPGWLYQVERGATTIWERWDAIQADGTIYDPDMNSYNHYAYGAVCQWLFEGVAGFRPDADRPGFERIVFEPTILPRLGFVRASHDSPAGRIEAGWTVTDGAVDYTVRVPEGAEGLLVLGEDHAEARLEGAAIGADPDGKSRTTLGPGEHRIRFRLVPAHECAPA
jgi:alpha-L-rhamnosidase